MKRRSVIAGLAAAAGSAAAVGSGAFDIVEADRDADVAVVGEDDAYLALEELDATAYENAVYARSASSNRLQLDFNEVADGDAQGPAAQSTYEFDNVFAVTNNGSQSVKFWLEDFEPPQGENLVDEFELYVGGDEDEIIDGDEGAVELPIGEAVTIGVKIVTNDALEDPETDTEGIASIEANEETDADTVYTYDGGGFNP